MCEIALDVVFQKFNSVPGLRDILLKTGNQVIAEMTSGDRNWGTGLDVGHPNASIPAQWDGTNILGWALMRTRNHIVLMKVPAQLADPINALSSDAGTSVPEVSQVQTNKQIVCAQCHNEYSCENFSKSQLKKKEDARCKTCLLSITSSVVSK